MSKFKFKLDSLLQVRRSAEQALQRQVAHANRERVALEDGLRLLQRQISDTKGALREGLSGCVDMTSLRLQAAATTDAMRRAQRLVLELAGVHRRLEAARAELMEAAKRRRAIELLRERRLHAWLKDLNNSETAAIDELAVIGAARGSPHLDLADINAAPVL